MPITFRENAPITLLSTKPTVCFIALVFPAEGVDGTACIDASYGQNSAS